MQPITTSAISSSTTPTSSARRATSSTTSTTTLREGTILSSTTIPSTRQLFPSPAPCPRIVSSGPIRVPTRGTLSCFTQNDFNAVRDQMRNEIICLTNVLQFMVNGSTNMKDVVASGNS